MIAIDTNVLVRVLVDDPDAPDQCQQAREMLLTHGSAWIAQIVLVETVWVLEISVRTSKTPLPRAGEGQG